jgi:hypothetical protein
MRLEIKKDSMMAIMMDLSLDSLMEIKTHLAIRMEIY